MAFWITIANIAAVGLAFWTMMGGDAYGICLAACIALPWLAPACSALSGGRIALSGTSTEDRPDLFIAAFAPAMAVCVKALKDFAMVDWQVAVIAGAAVSLVLTIALVAARNMSQSEWSSHGFGVAFVTAFWLISGTAYGYGLVTFANGIGDTVPLRTLSATVVDTSESRGRSADNYLYLEPGILDDTKASVDRALYDEVQPGSRVCVDFHKGSIGLEWYKVRKCSAEDVR